MTVDMSLVLEILNILRGNKDRTIRQLQNELRTKGITKQQTLFDLYDLLEKMNDMGLVEHTQKLVRLDLYKITEKGLNKVR